MGAAPDEVGLSQVEPLRVSPPDGASIPSATPIARRVISFGSPAVVCCDAQCSKAWGINSRPKIVLSDDPDDIAYLADSELDEAPANPGTYEGGCAKPYTTAERLNKWCVRECERSSMSKTGRNDEVVEAPDFSRRRYNMPWLHPEQPAPCDGSGEAGETEGLDPKDDSAVPAGQAPDALSSLRGEIDRLKERLAEAVSAGRMLIVAEDARWVAIAAFNAAWDEQPAPPTKKQVSAERAAILGTDIAHQRALRRALEAIRSIATQETPDVEG
jgi:hypothetical protein